jgi:hypothetical protein
MDLTRALSFGWAQQHGLSSSELQTLSFIALRGKTNEPELAFAWFPKYGQEWWAAIMMMSHSSLRKTLSRLRKAGLIVPVSGSVDERFSNVKGYGIPEHVMEECQQWYQDRHEMVYMRVPNTLEEISDEVENVTNSHNHVTGGHIDVTNSHIDNALTSTFALHTHVYTREDTHLLTDRSRPSVVPRKDDMKYEDEWSASKDKDDFDVPKEVKKKPAPSYGPNMRLTIHFEKKWMQSRETRLNLAVPWSVQKVFQARMKALLSQHSEKEIETMIDVFFRMVDGGQIPLKSDELWKDFWYNRGRLYKISTQTTDRSVVVDNKEELRRFKERMER